MLVPPDKTFRTTGARIETYERIRLVILLCDQYEDLKTVYREFKEEIGRLKFAQETEETHGFYYYDEIMNLFKQRKKETGEKYVYTTARTERI